MLTDDGGGYLLPYVAAGTYQEFVSAAEHGAPRQWVHGHKRAADADPVTVALGRRTTVDEALLPLGIISGRNRRPGGRRRRGGRRPGPRPAVQATTAADGTWFLTAWTGTYRVSFSTATQTQWAPGAATPAGASMVAVTDGGTTVVDDALTVPGSVAVTAVDARTGGALSTFCAETDGPSVFLPPTTRVPDPNGGYAGDCGSGTITLNRVHPEPYAVFASSFDGTHGAQWVGPHGGVGSRAAALAVVPAGPRPGAAGAPRAVRSRCRESPAGDLAALTDLQLGGNGLRTLPPQMARLVGLRNLYGLHDEPLMDPGFLYENPGYWSAGAQAVLAAYFASEHGFDRPR